MWYELFSKCSMFLKYLYSQHNFGHITCQCCHAASVNMWTLVSSLDDGTMSLDQIISDACLRKGTVTRISLHNDSLQSNAIGEAILHHAAPERVKGDKSVSSVDQQVQLTIKWAFWAQSQLDAADMHNCHASEKQNA